MSAVKMSSAMHLLCTLMIMQCQVTTIHGDPNHYDDGYELEEISDNSEEWITKDNRILLRFL